MIPLIFIWKLIRVWIIWVQICRAVLRKSSQSSRLKNVNPYCKLSIIIKSYGKLFVYSWKNVCKMQFYITWIPVFRLIVRSQPQNKWWFKVSYLKYEKQKNEIPNNIWSWIKLLIICAQRMKEELWSNSFYKKVFPSSKVFSSFIPNYVSRQKCDFSVTWPRFCNQLAVHSLLCIPQVIVT